VDHVEVGLSAPLLEGGLVLVDTPGIGSLDAAATERAYAFLPRVDAALLVLSPDPPLGEAEGVYLQALLDHTGHLLFVLNKVDLYGEEDWREAVAFNRRELAMRREEVRPLLPDATRRLVENANESLRACAEETQEPLTHSVLDLLKEEPRTGNAAMVSRVSGLLTEGVSGAFDAWWGENEEGLRGRLREAMSRAASGVDATGSTLSRWVEEEWASSFLLHRHRWISWIPTTSTTTSRG